MPSLDDLDLASIKDMNELKRQGKIAQEIANEYMDSTMKIAPKFVQDLEKTVPREALFAGLGIAIPLLSLITLVLFGAEILAAFVTVLQPLWKTYRALETEGKDDDTELLTFWMLHGVLYLAEHTILLPITALFGGPYFLAKMAFLFWALNFNGSTKVYNRFVRPHLVKHEDDFVELIDDVAGAAANAVRGLPAPSRASSRAASQKDV